MKNMKKILALVVAVLMIVASMSALAENETPANPTTAASKTITIDGLMTGDNVKYYQVIEWNGTDGWQFKAPFNTLSSDDLKEIVGSKKEVENTDPVQYEVVAGKLTDTMVAKIVGKITSETAAIVPAGDTLTGTTWTKTNQNPGLYVALIAPNDADVVYNPVFVAVQADEVGSKVTLPLNYADSGKAKKSTVTLDKTAKGANMTTYEESTTEHVGDVIDFKVTTTIPVYAANYTSPKFDLVDVLSDGLTLRSNAADEAEATYYNVTVTEKGDPDKVLEAGEDKDYTITKNANGYTISFTSKYLLANVTAKNIQIDYQAKITTDAANVNPEENTVTIEYSHNPQDTSDYHKKGDKTTHYTFSIDAGLQGDEHYTTSEIIKVGVDAAGNPVNATHTYDNGTDHHPLADAKFKLYTNEACTDQYYYHNDTIAAGHEFTTTDLGLMNIAGLDEGTYYLKESQAAPGFMLLTDIVKFVIEADYDTVAAATVDGVDYNAYKVLKNYTVKVYVKNSSTNEWTETGSSSYTFDNGTKEITKDENNHAGDVSSEIRNTQGTSLPSTGGMGTTILYIGGSILVILAAVLLITKRRMNAND